MLSSVGMLIAALCKDELELLCHENVMACVESGHGSWAAPVDTPPSECGTPEVAAICPFEGPAGACVVIGAELLHGVPQATHLQASRQ